MFFKSVNKKLSFLERKNIFTCKCSMAVPKKRLSKSKTKIRKNIWKKKATKKVNRILLLAKSYLKKIVQMEN